MKQFNFLFIKGLTWVSQPISDSKTLFRFVVFYRAFLKILPTSVSQKTFYQVILAAADYGLRHMSFEWKSNRTEMVKSTCCFKPKIYCNIQTNLASNLLYIQQRCVQNPFKRLSKEVYLFGGSSFRKRLHLRCLTRFQRRYFPMNHKAINPLKAKTHNMATLREVHKCT